MANERGRPGAAYPGFATRRRRGLLSRWWMWFVIGVLLQLIPWPAFVADAVYTRGIHPLLSGLTAPLHDAVPLSLAAALVMLFLIVLVLGLLSGPGGRRGAFGLLGWWLALSALTFPLTFGLAYRTTGLEARMGLDGPGQGAPAAIGPELVAAAGERVLAVLQESAATREVVGASFGSDPAAAAARCVSGYLQSRGLPGGASLPSRVKSVPDGALLRVGSTGVVFPWLLEPHVDPGLPAHGTAHVALHELAHAAGYAREAEAEALAILAGLECGDPRVRYASALAAARAISRAMPGDASAAYVARWPAGAAEDLAALAAAADGYRWDAVADAMHSVYDAYLVSQGASEGIGDYARATVIVVKALTAGQPAATPDTGG